MLDYRELTYGIIGVAVTAAALAPLIRHIVKTHRQDRAMRAMTDEDLAPEDLLLLRAAADLDTHVIPRGTVNKAVGTASPVEPVVRRSEIQPRRHRYDPALDTPRRSRAELARDAAAEAPRW